MRGLFRWRILAIGWAAGCVGAAVAQPAQRESTQRTSATLPESNEALLLSGRIETALQSGDYRLAIELLERLRDLPPGLVASPASATYTPISSLARRLFREMAPEGVALYRRLRDAEVDARFGAAARKLDIATLSELFRDYPAATSWEAIGAELAADLMDRGQFSEALQVIRTIESGQTAPSPILRAQKVVAFSSIGAHQGAERALSALRNDPTLVALPEWRARIDALENWLDQEAVGRRGLAAGALNPRIAAGAIWSESLEPAADPGERRGLVDALADLNRSLLIEPLLTNQFLLVRLQGNTWAFDALSLAPRWRQRERVLGDVPNGGRLNRDGLSLADEALVWNHLSHVLAADDRRVYTIEGIALQATEDDEGLGIRPMQFGPAGLRRNELVARDLASGAPIWRTGADPTHPLYDAAFQDRPVLAGAALVAPVRREDDLLLAVMDPETGAVSRQVPLVGPPTFFAPEGGRCLITADDGTLFITTGSGVVAALQSSTFDWKWATTYHSSVAQQLGRFPWQTPEAPLEYGIERPVLAEDLVIVAPIDSPNILGLDRFDGRERWRLSRLEHGRVAGVVSAGVVLVSDTIECRNLADPQGRPPVWKSAPLELTGKPCVSGERIFAPTRRGLVTLDARTGRLIDDQLMPDPDSRMLAGARGPSLPEARNLIAGPAALYSVSPDRVAKFPDLTASATLVERRAARQPDDANVLLAQAWLRAFAGEYEACLGELEEIKVSDPALLAASQRLNSHVALALARRASGSDQRLSWLRRAAQLAGGGAEAMRLALVIGDELERAGQPAEALRQYAEIVSQPGAELVFDEADPERAVAAWLLAGRHLRTLLDGLGVSEREQAVSATVSAALASDARRTVLQRLRVLLDGAPEREQISRALLLEGLPPEFAVDCLADVSIDGAPAEQRKSLLLAQWETRVALGMLEEAKADERRWRSEFEAGAGQALSDADEERVSYIRNSQRKLAQAAAPLFSATFSRQWKMEDAELLMDPRDPQWAARAFPLVRNSDELAIQMIRAVQHDHAWRSTRDALEGQSAGAVSEAAHSPFEGFSDLRRSAWPAIPFGWLTAVPVRGGLVCVGMGPERGGGQRLWQHPIPEWTNIPLDLQDRAVALGPGICVSPRENRVECVSWIDGAILWKRDFSAGGIDRIEGAGDAVLVLSQSGELVALRARDGAVMTTLMGTGPPVSGMRMVGETLLLWGEGFLAGHDPATLSRRWARDCPGRPYGVVEDQGGRFAYRLAGEFDWTLLDGRDGKPLLDEPLGPFDRITALATQGSQLLVAGQVGEDPVNQTPLLARIRAFDLAGRRNVWTRDIRTQVAVNATQLLCHPRYVPLLIYHGGEERTPAPDVALPAILLLDKDTGVEGPVRSIADDARLSDSASVCEMVLLATPTRMIVQCSGTLLGYGDSGLGESR